MVLDKHALTMNIAHTVLVHLSTSLNLKINNQDIRIHSSALVIVLIVKDVPLSAHCCVKLFTRLALNTALCIAKMTLCQGL